MFGRFQITLAACAVALACGGAAAAPGPAGHVGGDALLQLLHDKGLVPLQQAGQSIADASRSAGQSLVDAGRSAGDAAANLVVSALNFVGVPYKRGGNDAASGFDCSGFTRHLFEQTLGLVLPRRADQQAQQAGLREVPWTDLEPGDLVFFNTMKRAFSHVGIYVGNGRFIHAPRAGGQVRMESMVETYWTRRFDGARRVDWSAAGPPAPGPTPTARETR